MRRAVLPIRGMRVRLGDGIMMMISTAALAASAVIGECLVCRQLRGNTGWVWVQGAP